MARLVNLGCGNTFHPEWLNYDLDPATPEVRKWDIRQEIPMLDASCDAVYHSHVLEHLPKTEADFLIKECFRILKSGGVIRVAVPDLERIVRAYLEQLELALQGNGEKEYDWMMLELFDQTVRSHSGGDMGARLRNATEEEKPFIRNRIGMQAVPYWKPASAASQKRSFGSRLFSKSPLELARKGHAFSLKILVRAFGGRHMARAFEEGLFRQSGEIHRWMWDRFSLSRLLTGAGFTHVQRCEADQSRIPNFNTFKLDTSELGVRKPDSIFMEGIKE